MNHEIFIKFRQDFHQKIQIWNSYFLCVFKFVNLFVFLDCFFFELKLSHERLERNFFRSLRSMRIDFE